jgi:hypothetical protein
MPGDVPKPSDFSLVPFREIVMPLLDAVSPASVVEVGADRGDFTRELLAWAGGDGASVTAIDSEPRLELLRLAEANPELTLIRELSTEALSSLPLADALIIDGDHNYHTVSEELRLISGKAGASSAMPLLLIHDIGWPHARRDTYYEPDRVPQANRQPLAHEVMVAPGEPGTASAGILFGAAAAREGGARNGVLTAVEDFLAASEGLRLAIVPAFFGLGVLWPADAPWAGAVARIVEPWDSSPMLERLEALRVAHIVDRVKLARQEAVLRSMLSSRVFAMAERVSRLRGRRGPSLSREQVRRALDD